MTRRSQPSSPAQPLRFPREWLRAGSGRVAADPAALVGEERVRRPARPGLLEIVRERGLEQLRRAWPLDFEPSHAGDAEGPTVAPNSLVLGNDTLVLTWHLPAREGHHARAESNVPVVQRCAQKRLGHGQTMLTSAGKVPLRLCLLRGVAGAADRVVGSTGEDEPQEGMAQIPRRAESQTEGAGAIRPGGRTARRGPRVRRRSPPP